MQSDANGINGAPDFLPIEFSVDAFGRLVLTDEEGRAHVGVEPVRAFPISEPKRWIALVDTEGHEVLTIRSLDDLSAGARKVLEAELASREFVPLIERVVHISGDVFPARWDVQTDCGATTLELDSEDDIRRVGSHRVLITDARKMRYHVPDTRALDAYSRRVLERYV